MEGLYKYSRWLNRQYLAEFNLEHDQERASQIIAQCLAAGKTYLGELDGKELLNCYGFEGLPTMLARTREEARDFAEDIASGVAMKIVSPQIIHKSDANGVELHLKGGEAAMEAFDRIMERARRYNPEANIEGILVQKMAPPGEEVIVGASRYDGFGTLLMFGLGGIFVEVFRDVVFRFAPIGRNEARRMVTGIKGFSILKGFRGKPPADTEALERALVSLFGYGHQPPGNQGIGHQSAHGSRKRRR